MAKAINSGSQRMQRDPADLSRETDEVCIIGRCEKDVVEGFGFPLCIDHAIDITRRTIKYGYDLRGVDRSTLSSRWRPIKDHRPAAPMQWVYYVRVAGGIKIGTSINLNRRMVALRNVSPLAQLLATEPGARSVEGKRHLQFNEERIGTSEVFVESPRLLEHIKKLKAKYPTPARP